MSLKKYFNKYLIKLRPYSFYIWIILALIWLDINRSIESVFSLVIFVTVFLIVAGKKSKINSIKEEEESPEDPYAASYDVEGFHDDFTKVGSGYPVPKNHVVSCCNPLVNHGQPKCTDSCKDTD